MIKRSITFMTLALALTTLCQAQSRKIINLPSWDFSRDGVAAGSCSARLGYLGSF